MGMEQLWPLGLLALLPLIVLFYILKEKAEDRKVSSLYLWQEAYRSLEARTPWEKLRNNLLMYLQLLAMLLLVLALCSPYWNRGGKASSDVIIAIDNSGSMNSLYYDGEKNTGRSRLEEAKRRALDYVDSLPEHTKVTLIGANQTANLLFTGKTDHYSIRQEIRSIKGTDVAGNLAPAVDLAKAMESQWTDYQVLFFTDEAVDVKGLRATIENLGSSGRNLSITQVSHKASEDGTVDILVRVENTGKETLSSDVNLYLDGKLEEIQAAELASGEVAELYFRGMEAEETVAAELNEADDLASDNVGYDCIRKAEEKTVLLVSEKNVFLEKALAGLENVEVFKTNEASGLEAAGDYDFYIFDGIFPEKLPEKGSLLLVNPTESIEGILEIESLEEGVWIEEAGSSFGFGAAALSAIKTPSWAKAFYLAGEYGAGFSGDLAGQRITVLAFDIHGSEWPLLPEFPLKIYEIAQESLDAGLLSESRITAGATVNVHGQKGSWTYTDTEQCGLFTIKDGEEREPLAVNFPEEESRVWKAADGIAGAAGTTEAAGTAGDLAGQGSKGRVIVSFPLRGVMIWLILALLAVEWLVYLRQGTFQAKSRGQKSQILLLRGLLALCLLLAWVNPSVALGRQQTATVFLVDVSDSVAGKEEEAVSFVKEAMDALPEGEESGVIAFGKEARVEQFLHKGRLFSALETVVSGAATNLNQAVAAAIGMFPDNAPKRLVLLTDGKENEGKIEEFSTLLKEKKIKLLVRKWENAGAAEVSVESVSVPDKVSLGDVFKVNVYINSNIETGATLSLYAGNEKKAERRLELQKGSNQFVFTDTQTSLGLKSYRAILEPDEDTVSLNNEYSAYTQAEAQETVLFIEGQSGQGNEFAKLLDAANIAYQRIIPAAAPRTLMELSVYRSLLLLDVYAPDLPEGFMDNLETYVRDYGGGLVAIGGSNSFALGGYRDTPLEAVLPMDMDLKGEKEIPKMAMVMVIDRSGSMSSGDGNVSQLTLAKEAAVEALHSLRAEDEVGVIAFETTYDWVVDLQAASDKEEIEKGIDSIGLGGGTSIYPAVKAAFQGLEKSDAKRKHIILLTDGQDGFGEYDGLLKRLEEENISLSTVAVGQDSDQELLTRLAEQGNGRSYYTDIHSDIPRIFAQEVFLAAKEYLVNREFTPALTSNSSLVREAAASGVPSLYGYIAASPKERAQVHMISDTEDPIYATWQYGLGRTAAFTSDGENKWTRDWASWDGYPLLLKNMVNWTMTDMTHEENKLEVTQEGSSLKLSYELGTYGEHSSVEALLTDEEGKQQTMKLTETVPGSFEGEISLEETGIYGINVRQKEQGEVVASQNTAAALQYSEEYRLNEDISAFERFVEGNEGSYIDTALEAVQGKPEAVQGRTSLGTLFLLLCAILFLGDIAMRRFGKFLERKREKSQGKVKAQAKETAKKATAKKAAGAKAELQQRQQQKQQKQEMEKEGEQIRTARKRKVKQQPAKAESRLDMAELLKKKQERKGE